MKQIARKAALPAALVFGLGGAATLLDAVQDPVPALGAQAAPEVVREAEDLATAFRSASKSALPGVVFVEVETAPRAVSRAVPEQYRGTPFERYFGAPQQQQQRPRMGSGSGFIISPDGYILTNNHVVEEASRVTVTLTDKREFVAEVVGRDPNTDVAVLKVDAKDLPTVRVGTAEGLQVGDWVLALGYPMSLGETVTAGIVSAMGKSINILRGDEADAPIEHFIQTDAAINPGNSGGPLINLRGEVVGINTAIASTTGTYSGYGFAVPMHLAKRVADDLIRYGAVRRPRLGVQIKDVQPADVEVFGLPDGHGAVVAVLPDGPARDGGVRLGDVIVSVNGEPIRDNGDLMEKVALLQPGERAELGLIRYGKRTEATVKLGSFAAEPAPVAAAAAPEADAVGRLGFAAGEVTPAIARELGFERAEGVVVTGLDPMGPAAKAGLGRGFRIDRLNGAEIRSVADLRRAAAGLEAGATVSVIARAPTGDQTIVNFRLHG